MDYKHSYFNREHYIENLNKLGEAFNELGLKDRKCSSIREMDYFYAGLIFYRLIKGIDYDITKWEETKTAIEGLVNSADESHKQRPGQLQYLRKRIDESIKAYMPLFGVKE